MEHPRPNAVVHPRPNAVAQSRPNAVALVDSSLPPNDDGPCPHCLNIKTAPVLHIAATDNNPGPISLTLFRSKVTTADP